MNNELSPIPTPYHGFLFRSRPEARWAVFLEALEIKFWYEPNGFPLEAGWYLPDFFLPQVNLHAEVKPYDLDSLALAKCSELCLRSGKGVLLLVGPPDFRTYRSLIAREGGFLDDELLLLDIDYHKRRYYDQDRRFFSHPGEHFTSEEDFTPRYREAVFASRVAQFKNARSDATVTPRDSSIKVSPRRHEHDVSREILVFLDHEGSHKIKSIGAAVNVPYRQLRECLNQLKEYGFITIRGDGMVIPNGNPK